MNPPGETSYSLEITAHLTGMSAETILHYQEQGLIRPEPVSGLFDDEALRTLRRIEHLALRHRLLGDRVRLDRGGLRILRFAR